MDTELTLVKRGVRIVDRLKPWLRDSLDAMEFMGRVADLCYFDENGVLRLENKEYYVNEEYRRLVFKDCDKPSHSDSQGERQEVDISEVTDGVTASAYEEQYEESRSWTVS